MAGDETNIPLLANWNFTLDDDLLLLDCATQSFGFNEMRFDSVQLKY